MEEEERGAIYRGLIRSNVDSLILRRLIMRLYGRDARQIDEMERECLDSIAESAAEDPALADPRQHGTHHLAEQATRDFFREVHRLLERERHTGDRT